MTTETATPNQADASTAFLRAARAGQIEKIISLLEQGVDINVCNANGLNAIHLASKDGHVDVVRELLQRGAAIDAATKKGNTALHIASLAGQEAVVRLLILNGAQVNIQSQNGFTPLYMAAQENHDGVVKFLLGNGANQSLATEDGFTPLAVAMQQGHEKVVAVLLEADTRGRVRLPALHIAAKKDDVKAANLLLENEHNPDVTSKSGFTPLHIAAHYGNESVARLLLTKGADVNCPAKHNICPLHVAAKWGKDNMVTLLCDNGANVEARTRDGLTPLHCAARSGHERVVEALLERGAPITSKSKNGLAPLHMAAQGEHAEAARVLLGRRAPVDDVTVDYLTALHVAAHCGHAKVAKLLLDRNADANARALNGFTPLHIACKKNRIKVVELLLKYGASISATTESGLTPLHVAAFMGCMNIVIYLLQHEANPDVPTVRGETPLHLAARANQTDIIRILLRNGAAVEAKAREKQTPLHIASRLGNVDIAVLLLQHGADVRAQTADHYNALHIAAKQHNHDVAAALIEHGAPLTATTKKGFTPLHLAAKYGNLKVANLLLAHGASPDESGKNGVTPLHVAAQYDQQAVATTLLEKGADAKAAAKNGHTPLHIAARKNQMETAATLLEHGAITNAESKAGFTPLHLAAQQGHTEMCSLLLEHGADVNQQAKNGLAALHLAAQEDRVPVAQLLTKNGAQVDIETKGGYTPLHIASHYGQTNMVKYLLENDASVKAQTTHGYTALHHAAQQGHINIVNILLENKSDANATTTNDQTPLDIASKLGYVTVMETLKAVSEPSTAAASQDKYKVVAPETMYETFMSDSEEEGVEDTVLNEQPYRYLTADDMKSLGDDSLPIDVTRDERAESALGHKNIMEISQGSMNGSAFPIQDVVVKSVTRYNSTQAPEGYCYNVDPTQPKKRLQWKNFLVSFLVDARGGALRGCRGGGVKIIVPPSAAQQPTRITCRYLKPSRINHMPPLMEGEALGARVLEMGPVSAKFLGPVILEVPHYASLRGKEREIVILRSDNGTSWREHNIDATDEVVQDILNETLEIEENNEEAPGGQNPRVIRILTHDFPQYFAVISRIRQEVHAIGPEGGMVSSSVVPQVQAVFPQGALTKKIKVGLQAQIIDSELTAKLLGRGVAVSPVVTVEPRRRKFHKAITLSMPAPRPHTQGMTNQYSTSSAPTLRLLCSISGGTNRAHWEDVTENTPLTFVNDCVSFTTTVSARYWLIDCRHIEDATKMATELYREAIHVPFMARFIVYAKRTESQQAQLRMFCVTDDKEDKTLERIERFAQVAKSRDVEVHEGKPCYIEFAGNLVPVAKSGEQLSVPFKAFRENRLAFPVMVKNTHSDPVARCQFMREPKVPKGEPSPAPICVLNIVIPEEIVTVSVEISSTPVVPQVEDQELVWRQRLSDSGLEDICNLLGKDWVALAYELGVSISTVNQIQAKRITASEQAQLMLKLWKTQSGTKAQDNSLELALCRIGRDDIIAPQSEVINERRIQRNIYQERQASEEIEAYKAEEDNKLKDRLQGNNELSERLHSESDTLDQDEAKYSPEEKSFDKSEMERTPTPSEESEEDEDVKRSVAERKEQITRKLSSSKIPASKQKKEIREEIIEIKTQIKPDIKKFQDIEQQQVKDREQGKMERTRSKTSPECVDEETEVEIKKEDPKPVEKPYDQFKKYDPSSPSKPTPKHLQRHIRNDSMRFPSGDFSNVSITPRKSVTSEITESKSVSDKAETTAKEFISQKELDSSKVKEKLDDSERSPDLVDESDKDVADKTLKDKISSFESKMTKQSSAEEQKVTVKLTKEALKKHTMEHEQGLEYTQEFVREQSKQISSFEMNEEIKIKSVTEAKNLQETVKSVKETIQQFDSKVKQEAKVTKTPPKAIRTDSTLVQVSSEEDSEFLKKSTDSETETESQTTLKHNKEGHIRKIDENITKSEDKHEHFFVKKDSSTKSIDSDKHKDDKDDKRTDDDSAAVMILKRQMTDELKQKASDENISEILEEKDIAEFTSRKVSPKESPVISAKARQFIETVPDDDSVQECFFSKRIYSDSLEDSEHTDSRRHSEADSLKSDQSDVKAKVSSSDFDERAEYEETIDSGSGFGDEKFEDSVGFTSIKLDTQESEIKQKNADKIEESDVIFKKVIPKRHSRTESISISKLSDIQTDAETKQAKQEFQILVTEVEDVRSFEIDDPSDKISSESSREVEISDRKSSEGMSDKISSEDAVTEKKTSSEEEILKDSTRELANEKDMVQVVKDTSKEIDKVDSKIQSIRDDFIEKAEKRQSVASAGSISELRLEEKRLSDAHSLTESRDYTFEESEDDIGAHLDTSKEKVDAKEPDLKIKVLPGRTLEGGKLSRLTHGDSLDDVEGFPEDHVTEHVHKLPYIAEVGLQSSIESDKDITNTFLMREREVSLKLETHEDTPGSLSKTKKDGETHIFTTKETVSSYTVHRSDQGNISQTDSMKNVISSSHDQEIVSGRRGYSHEINEKSPAFTETSDFAKDHVKPVIDEILQKGSIVAAAKSSSLENNIISDKKSSYDAKAVGKEERRHSCISPAISLERIAESETEIEEEVSKFVSSIVSDGHKATESTTQYIKKSDSAMKQMADNIEIIIKQASEDIDISGDESLDQHKQEDDIAERVSVDSIIEEAVNTVEEYLESSKEVKEGEIEIQTEMVVDESKKISKDRPSLIKSLSRDSGEVVILPKKKQPRTFSVQSSPDEVEEQIYTDSESDMDKAKVLEIIEPNSDIEGKMPTSSFDPKKIRTDSLDDADDLFPEKDGDFFLDDYKEPEQEPDNIQQYIQDNQTEKPFLGKFVSKIPIKTFTDAEKLIKTDIISKSTTESSVTTVISTLTKSSDGEQRSIPDDATSADLSKLSGADLLKDSSKTSVEVKEDIIKFDDQAEDRGTPDMSKKSLELTKDYSKSSIDSKDTSRDFATNELSKDSTVDLSKDFSKASVESVRDVSKSIDEKTFSEDHSSLDASKTLASDLSEANKDITEDPNSCLKSIDVSSTPTHETSKLTDVEQKSTDKASSKEIEEDVEKPDMSELNRRCSNLLEDISQGALIRIDSSHVTHDLAAKFSKTPPPSPVDLINKDKHKVENGVSDKHTGLQHKGSDSSFLDANRQSPRASSAGDSLYSETEAHQSDVLTLASEVLSAAATPKSPTRHIAENLSFINVDQPTITSGAIELVDRTIEKSIDVIDQIKKEQLAAKEEHSTDSVNTTKKEKSSDLEFQSIDPKAVMTDLVSKFGVTGEFSTVITHKQTETKKISGQEYFIETKHVSSSDDDSLVIKTETTHELRGQEHEIKEKSSLRCDGDQTESLQKKVEKAHEAATKRSDLETKTVIKSNDDNDVVQIHREFTEQGLYSGRQTKSEEKMTALKDETTKKKHEVKYSERDLSHEQWGQEYFTEPGELENIEEDVSSKTRGAFIESSLKIKEKDETVSSMEVSEKGKIIRSSVEHHKEESVIESKDHDDLSSDVSFEASFKSETVDRRGSSELSPKSKTKSFKKDNEIYEVDFIKEIKISTSPIKSTFSRTGSQESHSESEAAPDLPHDDKLAEKEKLSKTPIKLSQQKVQDQVWEVSLQQTDQFETAKDMPKSSKASTSEIKSYISDQVLEFKTAADSKIDFSLKTPKSDYSPSIMETSDDMSTFSKDIMIKSGESVDTECMVKSLESQEAEVLQKSIDSTMSAETLHPSEFSTEADSAFLTGTDYRRDELKLVKEKSLEDICSSGYDTDLSSAEFHATKLESERVDFDSLISGQPLADLSVLEKTIDEVKQSLEAAQGEIINEKNDGSSKYKQSPSEFQFKLLISPDKPEVIREEPHSEHIDVKKSDKTDSQISDSISQKISSFDETTSSEIERDTVQVKKSSPAPVDPNDFSCRSDSGPHSIFETESDNISSDKDSSSKDSPEVKLRIHKQIKTRLGVQERKSASEVECSSSSGESHYQSFEHSDSRPLSSDVEVMVTAQSGTDFETALMSQDASSHSMRTSKDYYTAASSLASRDSMRSLDSDGSSHLASIDISDASETLVPSANELKEELMESSTYVEQFLSEKPTNLKDISDEDISPETEDQKSSDEPVGKMKRSHEMRFGPKDTIPEHFPVESVTESIDIDDDKEVSDTTTISSQFKTDEILSSSISKIDSHSDIISIKEEVSEPITKTTTQKEEVTPFAVTKVASKREFVDIDGQIISVGSSEYDEITKSISEIAESKITSDTLISKITVSDINVSFVENATISEECIKKTVEDIGVVPFSMTQLPPSQREFVDIDDQIIPEGCKQYEEILKSKSDSAVPKTKIEKSGVKTSETHLEDSKPSSTSSLKSNEYLSTPASAPSQSSISTDNGREYVLDDIYDISETPELKSDLITEGTSSRSDLVVTTEEQPHVQDKDQDSPISDEFELVDKPCEMDEFVVIEEVAKEAQETDTEGKALRITQEKYIKRHDTEVEEYLIKSSKKQDSSSASGSLSDEELLQYELEQKKVQAQELAEAEASKRWLQMQFEGDPRYDYERVPLEDIKEEEMTDFDASRIGSLSSQKESIGSFGSFKNSFGSLSESEMASRLRFRVRGENDDISISSLQEFENLEKALMEQYQQHSSSSQDSLNGSLPRRYILSKSQGDDVSVSSLKEFEGLESACLEALKAEILAKQKEALLLSQDPKEVSRGFLEHEKRSYSGGSSESSPPQKSGSPSQKSGSPSQKGGSPSQKVGSYGSPSQKLLTESASIRKIIDQQMTIEQKNQEQPVITKVITVKKVDDKGTFFVPVPESSTESCEVTEQCKKSSAFVCAATAKVGSAESIPGDCEEMMKILDQEEKDKQIGAVAKTSVNTGVIEIVKTTTVLQQRFVDGKKVSETITGDDGAIDIPHRSVLGHEIDGATSYGSEMSSSIASQQSDMDSLATVVEKHLTDDGSITILKQTITSTCEKPDYLEFSRDSVVRELSPSSGRSMSQSFISSSGKPFTDPASGSWSGQDEELSSSGSFSRGARADLMLGSTDSLEATSSNATRATYNYEVDTPMTGSLTSGGHVPGSNTMVSSLDTLDPVTAMNMESLGNASTTEYCSQDYEVQEPDSDTERLELDGRQPQVKERTIMFDSTDTLSAVSGDGSVKEGLVETAAPTFYIGDTPILRGERPEEEVEDQTQLSGSCPASIPPVHPQQPPPVPAQRRSLTMLAKSPPSSLESDSPKK